MDGVRSPSTAVFRRPFDLPGLGRSARAGEYTVRAEPGANPSGLRAGQGILLIDLNSAGTCPADHNWFRVSIEALDAALVIDKLPANERAAAMLENLLGDALVRLAMRSDPGLQAKFRQLNARILGHRPLQGGVRREHGKRLGQRRSSSPRAASGLRAQERAQPAA